jgi:hypothetical protein
MTFAGSQSIKKASNYGSEAAGLSIADTHGFFLPICKSAVMALK